MGGVQERASETWLTIQRNTKAAQTDIFNFSKERYLVSHNKITFPSYLQYSEPSKTITYSLFNEQDNEIIRLDYSEGFNPELVLTKIKSNLKDKIWKLVRQDEEVELKRGDFIKMGAIQLQIKELKFLANKQSLRNLNLQSTNSKQKIVQNGHNFSSSNYLKNSDILSKFAGMKASDISIAASVLMDRSISTQRSHRDLCRFCFESTSSQSNPLFNVCLCSGSVKNIHYQCLKSWVRNKMGRVQTSHCIYYHFEKLTCELCKHQIKSQITHNGRVYPLNQQEKMHPPFVRFQYTQNDKLYQILIRLEEQARIRIGSGSENEFRINDPSINKSQGSLYYTSQRIFLNSKNSKFGTFVELSSLGELDQNKPIQLLFSNNLIKIEPKQSTGILNKSCCDLKSTLKLVVK